MSAAACLASEMKLALSLNPQRISPGEIFAADARFEIPEGTRIYGKDSGQTGLATTIEWILPRGFEIVKETWQPPKEKTEEGLKVFVYENGAKISAEIRAPKNFSNAEEIGLKASWLACTKTQCMPQSGQAFAKIEPKAGGLPSEGASDSGESQKIGAAENSKAKPGGIFYAVLGAFFGGIILNLMPCVFPVIGLKIFSFAKDAGKSRAKALANAAFYSAGIVASFCALALVLIWIRNIGGAAGWGFQLQEPLFVAFLILLFCAMGFAFSGMFEIGASLTSAGSAVSQKSGKGEAFFSGVLAVIVASPCTAPFMGSALGIALAAEASAWATLAIFASLGFGMALPYALLSAIPSLAKFMPKPGAWLETFKQFLAFPLFATAIWLLSVFLKERDAASLSQMLFAILVMALALWIFGKYSPPANSKKKRIFAFASLALFGGISAYLACQSAASDIEKTQIKSANAWSQSRVEELRKEGKIVYVDFTASWCLTCLANKKAVLETEKIREFFRQNNVAILTADWTKKDPEITKYLKEFGRAGVPLNIVFSPDFKKPPVVLPEILTENAVMDAVDKAKF